MKAQVILSVGSTVCISQAPFSGVYWIGLQYETSLEGAGVFETLEDAKEFAAKVFGTLGWTEGDGPDDSSVVARGRLVGQGE